MNILVTLTSRFEYLTLGGREICNYSSASDDNQIDLHKAGLQVVAV